MLLLLLPKCVLFLVIQQGLAQSCLQSADLDDDDLDFGLPSGSQVIVTSYQFQCCGNITEWRATVRRLNEEGYTIHFQVWRPSPTVESDGCYSLVGENRFTSITPTRRLVRETPEPTSIITVQPGDVLGYYSVYRQMGRERGIALYEELRSETVWYHTSADPQILQLDEYCPFPAGPGRTLSSFTDQGPVISASLDILNCTSQPPATTTHSLLPTYTSYTSVSSVLQLSTNYLTMTPRMTTPQNAAGAYTSHITSHITASSASPLPTNYLTMTPHMTTPPKAAGMSVRNNTGIIAGVCVSAVLVVTLGILAAAIAIHRRKAREEKNRSESDSRIDNRYTQMKSNHTSIDDLNSDQNYEMIPHFQEQIPLSHIRQQNEEELTQNVAYISTPGIAVEANECYGSTTVPAPADQDDLYESI